jgi:hypothetical protein
MVDTTQQVYDKFQSIPLIPYNIISYMISYDNEIWKLLKYNDANAWKSDSSHPNLTTEEKSALIYDGIMPINNARVFTSLGQDDSILAETSFIRVGLPELIPTNHIRGASTIGFEILTHYKVSTLSNYQSRADTIMQKLIALFNGADIDGIGRIFFDARISSRCRAVLIGQVPYRGRGLTLCANILG